MNPTAASSMRGDAVLVVATLVALIGAFFDLRSGRRAERGLGTVGEIPNALTLGVLAIAPLAHGLGASSVRAAFEAAGASIAGAVLTALVPFLFFRKGAMGGGDVKLLAAIGAVTGPAIGIEAEFYAFVAALIVAPAQLAWEGRLLRTLGNSARLALSPVLPASLRKPVAEEELTWFRFGPAIAAGTALASFLHWSGRS
jgi:prepilin peptidase CpaA